MSPKSHRRPSTQGGRAAGGGGKRESTGGDETTQKDFSQLKCSVFFADILLWEDRTMSKKVWGIILIVVAVLAILGSLSSCHYIATSEDFITNLGGTIPGGKKLAAAAITNEKAYSIAGLGLGIILAVIGTMLLSDIPPSRHVIKFEDVRPDSDESADDKSGKWKF
jgi:hypothetical protein